MSIFYIPPRVVASSGVGIHQEASAPSVTTTLWDDPTTGLLYHHHNGAWVTNPIDASIKNGGVIFRPNNTQIVVTALWFAYGGGDTSILFHAFEAYADIAGTVEPNAIASGNNYGVGLWQIVPVRNIGYLVDSPSYTSCGLQYRYVRI